jgi:VanZ family protein
MEDFIKKLKLRLPAIGLLVITLVFWGVYDRYEAAGPVLLQSPALDDAVRIHGDCKGQDGRYILRVAPGGPRVTANFRIPGGTGYDRIRVRGRIKTDGVVAGRYRWRCARIVMAQYDENNKWIPGHHGLIAQDGTTDWTECEDVFEIDGQAAQADLAIQQLGREGVAEFDRLSVQPVQLRASFTWWRLAFAGSWLGVGVLFYRRCRLESRRLRRLILINAVIIMIGTLMPGQLIEDSAEYARAEAVKMLQSVRPEAPSGTDMQQPPAAGKDAQERVDRFSGFIGGLHGIGHFVLFASLCFLVYLSAAFEGQHRSYFLKVVFDILLFAGVTESLQYLTLDRIPGITDWLIDVAGLLAAFLLFLAVMLIRSIAGTPAGDAET